jgi:hypothetical protein
MDNGKTCFVICPIGDEGTDIRKWSDLTFNYIIKPVAEKFGYKTIRADHIKEPGMITSQIIDQLLESQLIIADLTNNNPNVFYELAIRHFTQKPYIQMIKSGQKIPFDIHGMRTVFFDIDLEHAEIAKVELSEQIESMVNGGFKAANPITLAQNYSIIQKALQNGKHDFNEEGISKAILEAINEMTYSIAEIKRDVFSLKESKFLTLDNNDERKQKSAEAKMISKFIQNPKILNNLLKDSDQQTATILKQISKSPEDAEALVEYLINSGAIKL